MCKLYAERHVRWCERAIYLALLDFLSNLYIPIQISMNSYKIKVYKYKNNFNHNNRILTCDVCKLNYGPH